MLSTVKILASERKQLTVGEEQLAQPEELLGLQGDLSTVTDDQRTKHHGPCNHEVEEAFIDLLRNKIWQCSEDRL
jgi:hypothetical protein